MDVLVLFSRTVDNLWLTLLIYTQNTTEQGKNKTQGKSKLSRQSTQSACFVEDTRYEWT